MKGKHGMTGRHGNHRRGPRVARVALVCETCGVSREMRPGEVRQRTGRFCSRACYAKAKDGRRIVPCLHCGALVRQHRRGDERTFCSHKCAGASKRVAGARWKDPEQIKLYMRDYLVANRARLNAMSAQWARNHRERRNELQRLRRAAYKGSFTAAEWTAVKSLFGRVCLRCLRPESDTVRLEPDHVVPVTKGGAHHASNIQPLCRSCNASKGAQTTDYRT